MYGVIMNSYQVMHGITGAHLGKQGFFNLKPLKTPYNDILAKKFAAPALINAAS